MNFKEVIELVAPSKDSIQSVHSYFLEQGISKEKIELHQSRDFMTVFMSVEKAEELFQVFPSPFSLIFCCRFRMDRITNRTGAMV
jgi:uncharacterized protein YpmB